ncbi:MAG: trypsin-like peptidase domain-containing protein [Archangiaceae bacterium]|nr:trypsin-like peptidase domain-containing protein [Archangiaceae bacterium]
MRRTLSSVLVLFAALGCGRLDEPAHPGAVESRQDSAIYGPDDRVEVYEAPEPWRTIAQRSVAALVLREHFTTRYAFCDGGLTLVSLTEGQDNQLCPEVRFQEQHLLSSCSSTLIGPRLMLTAAHCIEPQECAYAQFVFGAYYSSATVLGPIEPKNFYGCKRIVYRSATRDVLIAELDRPVEAPFAPAQLANVTPVAGDGVTIIGFPTRGPMKVSPSCNVIRTQVGFYDTNCDVFGGNSGSSMYDADAGIFAVFARGPGDFVPVNGRDCRVPTQYDDGGRLVSNPAVLPQLTSGASVLEALGEICDAGVIHPRCGVSDMCGDGQCTGSETEVSCAADCHAPMCGDSICHWTEQQSCPNDCGTRNDGPACGEVVDAGMVADGGVDGGIEPQPMGKACGCSSGGAAVVLAALALLRRLRPYARRAEASKAVERASAAPEGAGPAGSGQGSGFPARVGSRRARAWGWGRGFCPAWVGPWPRPSRPLQRSHCPALPPTDPWPYA